MPTYWGDPQELGPYGFDRSNEPFTIPAEEVSEITPQALHRLYWKTRRLRITCEITGSTTDTGDDWASGTLTLVDADDQLVLRETTEPDNEIDIARGRDFTGGWFFQNLSGGPEIPTVFDTGIETDPDTDPGPPTLNIWVGSYYQWSAPNPDRDDSDDPALLWAEPELIIQGRVQFSDPKMGSFDEQIAWETGEPGQPFYGEVGGVVVVGSVTLTYALRVTPSEYWTWEGNIDATTGEEVL